MEMAYGTGAALILLVLFVNAIAHFLIDRYIRHRQLADFIGGCGAGRFYMCLEPNGDMYPCVFFPHVESMKVGNLFKDDFEHMWRHSKLFWNIRDKDNLKENCRSCEYRYTCGGCRARAYNYFRDVLAPDPGCVLNKEAWEKVAPKSKIGR